MWSLCPAPADLTSLRAATWLLASLIHKYWVIGKQRLQMLFVWISVFVCIPESFAFSIHFWSRCCVWSSLSHKLQSLVTQCGHLFLKQVMFKKHFYSRKFHKSFRIYGKNGFNLQMRGSSQLDPQTTKPVLYSLIKTLLTSLCFLHECGR